MHYIQENSHKSKIKAVAFSFGTLILIIFLVIFFYDFWYKLIQTIPLLSKILISLRYNLINTTPLGLFYGHLIGGLFFVPSADELIFYYGLMNGNSIFFSFVAALGGYLLAQILNYILGYKASGFLLHLVSKKKVYKTKRWVNKYGAYGIFIFNLTPLPAPLLTFALGVTKYNFNRLFLITAISKILEYSLLIGAFLLFHYKLNFFPV